MALGSVPPYDVGRRRECGYPDSLAPSLISIADDQGNRGEYHFDITGRLHESLTNQTFGQGGQQVGASYATYLVGARGPEYRRDDVAGMQFRRVPIAAVIRCSQAHSYSAGVNISLVIV